jgi:predicted dehydrogenase
VTDELRWGILSTANIGVKAVIPATRASSRGEVIAIASRGLDRALGVAEDLGIPRAYGSYEELLADPDVDAIYNPLPNHLHAPWSIAAAEAGKHVLCEKPLALSADEARDIIAACDSAGVKLMEAFMYRLHPQWGLVRQLVSERRIGELKAINAWFSYNNTDPTNIRNVVEWGGGGLMDIGCYCINVSRMLFRAEPDDVHAMMQRHPEYGTDVVTSAVMRFGSGLATFTCSTVVENFQRVHVVGTAGRIEIEVPFNAWGDRPNRVVVVNDGDGRTDAGVEVLESEVADQYQLQADAFAAAVLDDLPVPVTNADSVANMTVIERVFAAAEG